MSRHLAFLVVALFFAIPGLGANNSVSAILKVLDARYCGGDDVMDMLQITAEISLSNESSDAVNIPKGVIVERILIARSKDDIARQNYESNSTITEIAATSSKDLSIYRLEKGAPLSLIRQVTAILMKKDGQPKLALAPQHYVSLVLGMPLSDATLAPSTSGPVVTTIRTEAAVFSLQTKSPAIGCRMLNIR